ncbi:Lrp/AsnC family transcriptional regulator [Marinovum sp. 2_MG-2023]|uniref:Lrp/AsnC family transcriptional regulator n=1 Tax=unclassified Marinovum TaxID=2647166 RepID=UPI0026E23890|nr:MULTISPECIES: Lrp/AsnC family transcriptional regulator [unclassified Marinovum]MDO6731766.1 Lrp/AsnC family transcriptional regulator [Marinovum sp. 2_MG-2023]MDO6781018.1 Lrp/AsnC family transcriptional regulator [Marinovum sp. 1_MG-2023]
MTQLDAFDLKILRALQKDASQSMDALAEAAGLSRNACWRRMRMLEEAGVIRGRVALLDAAKVGCPLQVYVLVRTNAHDAAWMEKFGRAVQLLPEITAAHRMTGDLDYILRVRVADVPAYDVFYKKLIAMVPLSDISASFVMEDIKDTTAMPL